MNQLIASKNYQEAINVIDIVGLLVSIDGRKYSKVERRRVFIIKEVFRTI